MNGLMLKTNEMLAEILRARPGATVMVTRHHQKKPYQLWQVAVGDYSSSHRYLDRALAGMLEMLGVVGPNE